MAGFREFAFYSPFLDSEAVRLSVYDQRGSEFFMIVPMEDGKAWRKRRDEALGIIGEAIDAGLQPGEVRLR